MIATGGAAGTAVSYFLHGGGSTATATEIYDNYFDTTAAYGAFYSGSFTGASIYNNVDMNTGKIIQANDLEVPFTTVSKVITSPASGVELSVKQSH